jgi:rhamnose transport system substrate-binding protein
VALWNPIDLGYSAVMIANQLVTGAAKAEPGATISIGRVGSITLGDDLSAAMAAPFTFDKTNIEEFSKIY